MTSETVPSCLPLRATQIEDLKLASSHMTGAIRRAFQAQMTLKYCAGNARQAERLFGWGRETVQLGLHEQRTGILCLEPKVPTAGNPSGKNSTPRWLTPCGNWPTRIHNRIPPSARRAPIRV